MRPNTRTVAEALARLAPGTEVRRLAVPTRTAAEAAAALGCGVGAIANRLVFVAADTPLLVTASGAHRVDLAHVAGATGLPHLRRASPEEVRAATGQPIGGVAAVGHRALRTPVDRALAAVEPIWAAAGTPDTLFPTTDAALVAMTGGEPVDVAP
jgi:prolyl-tRNA editing enzyme YbaK/EbsC (Cys-tRNA(Pro) deacylase)